MAISWKGTLQQYAGRLHREHATKTEGSNDRLRGHGQSGTYAEMRMWDKRQRSYGVIGRCVTGRWQSIVRNAAMRVSARKHTV
jgi:hypothetical protein